MSVITGLNLSNGGGGVSSMGGHSLPAYVSGSYIPVDVPLAGIDQVGSQTSGIRISPIEFRHDTTLDALGVLTTASNATVSIALFERSLTRLELGSEITRVDNRSALIGAQNIFTIPPVEVLQGVYYIGISSSSGVYSSIRPVSSDNWLELLGTPGPQAPQSFNAYTANALTAGTIINDTADEIPLIGVRIA